MVEPGRSYVNSTAANNCYRFGFNDKENDNDIDDGVQNYGYRIYNGGLGKFFSVDWIT
jgi:hypothetical protein